MPEAFQLSAFQANAFQGGESVFATASAAAAAESVGAIPVSSAIAPFTSLAASPAVAQSKGSLTAFFTTGVTALAEAGEAISSGTVPIAETTLHIEVLAQAGAAKSVGQSVFAFANKAAEALAEAGKADSIGKRPFIRIAVDVSEQRVVLAVAQIQRVVYALGTPRIAFADLTAREITSEFESREVEAA